MLQFGEGQVNTFLEFLEEMRENNLKIDQFPVKLTEDWKKEFLGESQVRSNLILSKFWLTFCRLLRNMYSLIQQIFI